MRGMGSWMLGSSTTLCTQARKKAAERRSFFFNSSPPPPVFSAHLASSPGLVDSSTRLAPASGPAPLARLAKMGPWVDGLIAMVHLKEKPCDCYGGSTGEARQSPCDLILISSVSRRCIHLIGQEITERADLSCVLKT